jgi:hypothetical protein
MNITKEKKMRLTKEALKRIIKEELDNVLNEGIGDNFYGMYGSETQSPQPSAAAPPTSSEPEVPSGIKPDHADKIKKMLQADDEYLVNQALTFIDTLAPGSSYGTDYLEYLDANKTQATLDSYGDSYDPDERIDLKKKAYDQINQRAARLYPNDKDAANNWAMDKIEKAGLLEEGILNQMKAEKILRDEFFRVKELRAQGKATDEEVRKAYEDMKNLDKSQFYTDEELASAEAERAEQEQRYFDRLDSEDAAERAKQARLDQDRIAALKMRGGYKDRGIDMGPDDPGDVDDLYPDLREGLMYEGDDSALAMFENATLEEGGNVCGACLFEQLQEASCGCPDLMGEAEYQGRKVTLNKPTRGDVKKFKVYVKDPSTGNVKKVNFGDPNMKIKKSNPKRRKSFRARHNCDNPGPKTKARYWSCKKW